MSEVAPESGEVAVRGLLVAHGAMAEGMVDAVRRIAGTPPEALLPVSNEGMGPKELQERVEALLGPGPAIIFTDLQSGSCTMAARITCGGHHPRAVLCGVNLPMLLDFVFHRTMSLEELVPRLVEKGRAAMRCFPDTPASSPRGAE